MTSRHLVILVRSVVLLHLVLMETSAQTCKAKDTYSQPGHALLNLVYHSFITDGFPTCLAACRNDNRCYSLNFHLIQLKCEMNRMDREIRPTHYVKRENSIYMSMNIERDPFVGSKVSPGKSCRHIMTSGYSLGTGEYWIDPANTGSPLHVYCDMTTNGGGWTLVKRTVLPSSTPSETFESHDTYKVIAEYSRTDKNILPYSAALRSLHHVMGFDQIQFCCYKKSVGRVVHIITMNNTAGHQVVHYFTDDAFAKSTRPPACGSFEILPDDNSTLSRICSKWGGKQYSYETGTWGHDRVIGKSRIVGRPFHWKDTKRISSSRYYCEDDVNGSYSAGDKWEISVR